MSVPILSIRIGHRGVIEIGSFPQRTSYGELRKIELLEAIAPAVKALDRAVKRAKLPKG